ncbi:hypothetical protein SR858_19305 [Duganella zoogloeoides]|uniref:Uncharacterized protein n=1 Tax=Duganella zoogloeoides TaxID=75659 RepID=A0ABZ0XUW7_9BURK|nr:hypothetical protein [Duganella zoogloeoides]WQH03184.1 hypothetical protein SR858_19305 [Duganella zoogloeoides]
MIGMFCGGFFDALLGILVDVLVAGIEADAAVIDDNITFATATLGLVAANIFLDYSIRGKQLVLQNGSGNQHQYGKHQELPPGQLRYPGSHRIEGSVQPGGDGFDRFLGFWQRKHVRLSLSVFDDATVTTSAALRHACATGCKKLGMGRVVEMFLATASSVGYNSPPRRTPHANAE